MQFLKCLLSGGERGQGLVEYSLMLSLVAVVAVASVVVLGDGVIGLYESVTSVWP